MTSSHDPRTEPGDGHDSGVRWAAAHTAEMAAAATDEVLARVPFYGGEHPTVSHDDLRDAIEVAFRLATGAVEGEHDLHADLEQIREIAERRARLGVPLPELLQVTRIAFTVYWKAVLGHDAEAGVPVSDTQLTTATRLMEIMDVHAVAVTEAYRTATASMLAFQSRRRSALVEALLTGHPAPDAGPWEAAALLGFPRGGRHAVVVADVPGVGEEGLPEVEERLGARGLTSAWRLTPSQQFGVVALRDVPVEAVAEVLESIRKARAGVSPAFDDLTGAPRAAQLAQAALQTAPELGNRIQVFSSSPLAALVVFSPSEGQRLATEVLGRVLALPEDDRVLLIDTLWVYLEHSGSAESAAPVLYCHPNTVRYRLRRLQEMTGRRLSNPVDVTELTAAVYALRLNPDQFRDPGHTRS